MSKIAGTSQYAAHAPVRSSVRWLTFREQDSRLSLSPAGSIALVEEDGRLALDPDAERAVRIVVVAGRITAYEVP
jgi:hypothetical protein